MRSPCSKRELLRRALANKPDRAGLHHISAAFTAHAHDVNQAY